VGNAIGLLNIYTSVQKGVRQAKSVCLSTEFCCLLFFKANRGEKCVFRDAPLLGSLLLPCRKPCRWCPSGTTWNEASVEATKLGIYMSLHGIPKKKSLFHHGFRVWPVACGTYTNIHHRPIDRGVLKSLAQGLNAEETLQKLPRHLLMLYVTGWFGCSKCSMVI
jgi:hypothetical protein